MPMEQLRLVDQPRGFGRVREMPPVLAAAATVLLLAGLTATIASADDGSKARVPATTNQGSQEIESSDLDGEQIEDSAASDVIGGNDQDPAVMLLDIGRRRTERESLWFRPSNKPVHDATDTWHERVYQATHLRLGASVHHLFQWLSESLPGTDDWGTATDMDLIATWEAVNRGKPAQGSLTLHLETRWNWGTTGPMTLGAAGLGMVQNTGNTFESYVPAMIIRNLYWQTGNEKSKGALRLGKVTIDSILGTSAHLTPNTTFLTFAGTGAFAIALPDSGLGAVGVWHFTDRLKLQLQFV
jgi:hypothetical protein